MEYLRELSESVNSPMKTPTKGENNNDILGFTPDPEWKPENVEISSIDVSMYAREDKYVKVLSNVLTEKECQDLIKLSEDVGFVQAKVNTGAREVLMTDVRNNDRCIIDSPITMEFIWQRLVTILKGDADLMRAEFTLRNLFAVGLNERMRILRYDPGTYFSPHYDGCYQRGHDAGDRAGEYSCVTFQLYLNEGFKGGATKLLSPRDELDCIDVIPKTGSVLLFQHDVYHEGAYLVKGRKYALRTDVMYTTKGPGKEYANDPIVL